MVEAWVAVLLCGMAFVLGWLLRSLFDTKNSSGKRSSFDSVCMSRTLDDDEVCNIASNNYSVHLNTSGHITSAQEFCNNRNGAAVTKQLHLGASENSSVAQRIAKIEKLFPEIYVVMRQFIDNDQCEKIATEGDGVYAEISSTYECKLYIGTGSLIPTDAAITQGSLTAQSVNIPHVCSH